LKEGRKAAAFPSEVKEMLDVFTQKATIVYLSLFAGPEYDILKAKEEEGKGRRRGQRRPKPEG